jgi:hypothetical protein
MNCGVYKITDIETGDFYIGSAKKLRIRKTQHFSDLKNGRHENDHLQHIYNKNRELRFEAYILTRPEDRLFFEQRCIDMLEPKLNKTLNALAPMDGKTHSEEYVGKLRERALSPDSPLKSASAVAARSGDNHYMRRADYDKSKHPSKNPEIVAKRTKNIFSDESKLEPYIERIVRYNKSPEGRAAKSAQMTGEKHPQSKLTLLQAIEIIISNKKLADISSEYGICLSQASNVKRGNSWACARTIINEINNSDETLAFSEKYGISAELMVKIKEHGLVTLVVAKDQ